jgi:hypothetical protein
VTGPLRRDHWCEQDIGLNAGCGEEAYDLRGGEWMCDRHIARYDFDIYATAVLDECPEDWDVERTCVSTQESLTRVRYNCRRGAGEAPTKGPHV